MSFLRPEILEWLKRWSGLFEVLPALALAGWLWAQGGWVAQGAGALVLALGLGWGWNAWRRARFLGAPNAPGMIELVEARLCYLHPSRGGEMDLGDLDRLSVVETQGHALWHLRDEFGRSLYIPVETAGAALAFDAFAGLSGMDLAGLSAAVFGGRVETGAATGGALPQLGRRETVVWRRGRQVAKAGLRVV